MQYDFDCLIYRKGTNSLSEDGYPSYLFGDAGVPKTIFEQSELISMWVADMQFAAPQVVIDAIEERLKHPMKRNCGSLANSASHTGLIATVMMPDEELRAVWRRNHFQFVSSAWPLQQEHIEAANHGCKTCGPTSMGTSRWSRAFLATTCRTPVHIPGAAIAWIDISRYLPDAIPLTRLFFEHAGVILLGRERFVASN